MLMNDVQLILALKSGDIKIYTKDPKEKFTNFSAIQPASIDLRLGTIIKRKKKNKIAFDLKENQDDLEYLDIYDYSKFYPESTDGYDKIKLKNVKPSKDEKIILGPKQLIHAEVFEQIYLKDNYCARIEGKSKIARAGISIHCTGDYINPGWAGRMPLQIINNNPFPVILYPLMEICQLFVYKLNTPKYPYSASERKTHYDDEIHPAGFLNQEHDGNRIKNMLIWYQDLYEGNIKFEEYKDNIENDKNLLCDDSESSTSSFTTVNNLSVSIRNENKNENKIGEIENSAINKEIEMMKNSLKEKNVNDKGLLDKIKDHINKHEKKPTCKDLTYDNGIIEDLKKIASNIGCTLVYKILEGLVM